MTTGDMGYLLAENIKTMEALDLYGGNRRITRQLSVAVVDIIDVQRVDGSLQIPTTQLLLSYFTMITSVACAVFSLILFNDPFCFAAITLGILINGISTMVIGMGDISLITTFSPAPRSPPGDGLLLGNDFIVLRGQENHVNAITKGKFVLKMIGQSTNFKPGQNSPYHEIGICSLLYLLQFIAQLFLIPQGNLPGQIMFVISFAVAWLNNGVIASIDKEATEMLYLRKSVNMKIRKYALPSRTRAAVFACLSLCHSVEEIMESSIYDCFDLKFLLKHMLPSDTRAWRKWRDVVRGVLERRRDPDSFDTAIDEPDCIDMRDDERQLLAALLQDARETYEIYHNVVLTKG